MRKIWASIFPDRFLPLPVPITENELTVPRPKDVKLIDKLHDLWQRMVIQPLIPKTGYPEIPYEMYCPTIQNDIAKRICKDCGT